MRKSLMSLTLMLAAGSASAAPPSAESIERLLSLTRAEALVENTYAQLEPFMRQTLRAAAPGPLTPAQQKAMDELAPQLVATLRVDFNWGVLKPEYIRIYQETLDQTEVDGLIAFYETPVGQSTISKMPLVMQRSLALSQQKLQTLMPRIQRLAETSAKKALSAR